jgi:hypothetical protein
MPHTIKIYLNDKQISVEEAIEKKLIYRDEQDDLYLSQDVAKLIKINGEVRLHAD